MVISEQFKTEIRILIFGGCLLAAYFLYLLAGWLWPSDLYYQIVSLTITRLAIGRPGGIYFGYVIGLAKPYVILVNVLVDTIGVCLVYPLFVFTFNKVFKSSKLKDKLDNLLKAAKLHQNKVQKYGIPGLFIFVLIPLWGTGPVVGSVIGYLIHLKTTVNIATVLCAVYTAIIIFSFVFEGLYVESLSFGEYASFAVIGSFLCIVIGFFILKFFYKKAY